MRQRYIAHFCCGLGVVILGLSIRISHLNQSLWYDEMTTLTDYVMQPWSKILAAKTGEYVPNNHVLHTILVKLIYTQPDLVPPREWLLRLPALLAGLLVPLALVWPLRHSDPWLAFGIAIITTLHPWLVDFSVEARGYSLLLLLGIVATNLLPIGQRTDIRGSKTGYVIILTLAMYTVPLAVLLIPAHALAILILQRSAFFAWLKTAMFSLLLAALLYLPMYRGLLSYYRHPYQATLNYRQFLDALPRSAYTGSGQPGGPAIFWALPVIAIVLGSLAGWRRVSLRPMLVTLGVATILGTLLPLLSSAATEVRFVPWILPWFCLAIVSLLYSTRSRLGLVVGFVGFLVLVDLQVTEDLTLLPQQPIREGIELIDRLAPRGRDIMVLSLGARESAALYGDKSHPLLPAPDTASMLAMEKRAIAETGHLPWVIIFYEKLAMQRDLFPPETRGLWTNLQTLYDPLQRLSGQLTPVTVYKPKAASEEKFSNYPRPG